MQEAFGLPATYRVGLNRAPFIPWPARRRLAKTADAGGNPYQCPARGVYHPRTHTHTSVYIHMYIHINEEIRQHHAQEHHQQGFSAMSLHPIEYLMIGSISSKSFGLPLLRAQRWCAVIDRYVLHATETTIDGTTRRWGGTTRKLIALTGIQSIHELHNKQQGRTGGGVATLDHRPVH